MVIILNSENKKQILEAKIGSPDYKYSASDRQLVRTLGACRMLSCTLELLVISVILDPNSHP